MRVNGYLNSSLIRVYDKPLSVPSSNSSDSSTSENSQKLDEAQTALVQKLQAIDTKVREHEAAHIAAGGGVIKSGANFTYTQGPDNRLYATAGEVAIDTGEEATPEETIPKMRSVRRAALAPADPSATDYQVASTAVMMEMKARLEISQNLQKELLVQAAQKYANNEETSSNLSLYA